MFSKKLQFIINFPDVISFILVKKIEILYRKHLDSDSTYVHL